MVLNFPFSDLSQVKRRPALVLAELSGNDFILCQITSRLSSDPDSVPLDRSDFSEGGLNRVSRIRPERLFTADDSILLYRAGHITSSKLSQVLDRLIAILSGMSNS